MKSIDHVAHVRESDGQFQLVEEHLLGVQKLAEVYGEKVGLKHLCGLAGLLHDVGKYTEEFQIYLREAINHPENPPKRGSVDHSSAGGRMLFERIHNCRPNDEYEGLVAEIVSNAVISHHSFLHDYLTPEVESPFLRRVSEKELNEFEDSKSAFFENVMDEEKFSQYIKNAANEVKDIISQTEITNLGEIATFLNKYVFSALVDADRTNTREFEENLIGESLKDNREIMSSFYSKLNEKLNEFSQQPEAGNNINILRAQMSEECEQFAEKESGIYTLSIPTGGGKTLAGLRYALKHAMVHRKQRIIYVVPFTTIIEQNAQEVRNILKDDANVLEHHSNIIDDEQDDEAEDGQINTRQKLKLAKDNWDIPIVFTTMVQYLNAFYAKGSSNARRLHNLANSVIIFDEVQKVPSHCVSLFNFSLNFLKNHGRSSMLLCTATQPALDYVENQLDIEKDSEIVRGLDKVTRAFKRVEMVDEATNNAIGNEELAGLAERIMEDERSLLVILNTKSVVRNLYQLLKDQLDIPVYHLSTSMCAAHRNEILSQVREHLGNKEQVVCLSTQLIEAGVDVDFDSVIRSLAGLDSMAQAAGRCNRNGKSDQKKVHMIDHKEENILAKSSPLFSFELSIFFNSSLDSALDFRLSYSSSFRSSDCTNTHSPISINLLRIFRLIATSDISPRPS